MWWRKPRKREEVDRSAATILIIVAALLTILVSTYELARIILTLLYLLHLL